MRKHQNITSVTKTKYINNKRLDVVDNIEIPEDMIYKHEAVVLCDKQQIFIPNIITQYIWDTNKETNEVKYFDTTYNYENKAMKCCEEVVTVQ